MAFNITAPVPAITGLTVTPGVESVVLKWDPIIYEVEVWRNTANTFSSATLVSTTNEAVFTDPGRTPGTLLYYWVRGTRTLATATGLKVWGATTSGQATPARAALGTSQVTTANIALGAITVRSTYEETADEWVEHGKNPTGSIVAAGEETWTLPDIAFTGDGNTMVITCIMRGKEMPVYWRVGGSSVTAMASASIIDVTGGGTVLDVEELSVGGMRLEQFPVAPSQWISSTFNRDFSHNFIFQTTLNRNYAIRFKMWCFADNASNNYIKWISNLRQVLWQTYKR